MLPPAQLPRRSGNDARRRRRRRRRRRDQMVGRTGQSRRGVPPRPKAAARTAAAAPARGNAQRRRERLAVERPAALHRRVLPSDGSARLCRRRRVCFQQRRRTSCGRADRPVRVPGGGSPSLAVGRQELLRLMVGRGRGGEGGTRVHAHSTQAHDVQYHGGMRRAPRWLTLSSPTARTKACSLHSSSRGNWSCRLW